MMKTKYYLKENLLERNAMNFVDVVADMKSTISFYRDNERRVNGKSRIGILSGRFMQGETINIEVESSEDMSRVKEILNTIGTEV